MFLDLPDELLKYSLAYIPTILLIKCNLPVISKNNKLVIKNIYSYSKKQLDSFYLLKKTIFNIWSTTAAWDDFNDVAYPKVINFIVGYKEENFWKKPDLTSIISSEFLQLNIIFGKFGSLSIITKSILNSINLHHLSDIKISKSNCYKGFKFESFENDWLKFDVNNHIYLDINKFIIKERIKIYRKQMKYLNKDKKMDICAVYNVQKGGVYYRLIQKSSFLKAFIN